MRERERRNEKKKLKKIYLSRERIEKGVFAIGYVQCEVKMHANITLYFGLVDISLHISLDSECICINKAGYQVAIPFFCLASSNTWEFFSGVSSHPHFPHH